MIRQLVFAAGVIGMSYGVICAVRAGVESMFEVWPPAPPQTAAAPAGLVPPLTCGGNRSGRAGNPMTTDTSRPARPASLKGSGPFESTVRVGEQQGGGRPGHHVEAGR